MKKTYFLLLVSSFFLVNCGSKSFEVPSTSVEFIQGTTYNSKVDILLMIDNSSSMGIHQQKLSNDIPLMIEALNDAGMDWQIGVTSTDMNYDDEGDGGALMGSPAYITKSTPSATTMIQRKILIGEFGSNNERGLDSVKATLDPVALAKYAPGFLRDDAMLSIIFFTDEDDHSTLTTPTQLIAHLDVLKKPFPSGAKSWIANLLGTLQPSAECTANRSPAVASLYKPIVIANGGVQESICKGSLAQAVQNVKVRMLEFVREYHLDRIPKIDSIKIYSNGVLVPASTTDGWEYISEGNFIRFHGSFIPSSDVKIKVDFDPAEAT